MNIVVTVLSTLLVADAAFKFMESSMFQARTDFILKNRAPLDESLEVVFSVKQRNLDVVHDLLMQVSLPHGPKYGQYLKRQELADLTAHPEASAAIESYLLANGVTIVKKSYGAEYITAQATVEVWEKLFNTNFYHFENRLSSKVPRVARAFEYSVDEVIAEYVEAVFNTVHLPPLMHTKLPPRVLSEKAASKEGSKEGTKRKLASGSIIPSVLNSYYNVTFNDGGNYGSQSVFETIEQNYSPVDLTLFQTTFDLPIQAVAVDIGGYNTDNCANPNNCAEANLDVQYMMAESQSVPTTYYYEPAADSFLAWITAINSMENPPLINSISYGSNEASLPTVLTKQFNTEAQKAGLLGVTVFVSSGDDGAAGSAARGNAANCGYAPSFPATSPYVTAVGATQGAEIDSTEVVCSASTGGVITSGGGFSTKFAALPFQSAAIAGYLKVASPAPVAGYTTTGRGYPDLSLAGYNYEVIIGGRLYLLSGTSASSPTLAAFVALINSQRLAANKPPLGFINPAIYSLYSSFVNDIVTGNNLCTASTTCCAQGFYAAPGWDPATGFGTVNFGKFVETFLAL